MKTIIYTSALALLSTLGFSSLALAAEANIPYNLSTEPASTAWQATPLVGEAPDTAKTPTAKPADDRRLRPIGQYSGKSNGRGKNVNGEAIVTLNNDTPTGEVQLFGEIVGGVSSSRTR
ncbi:MAG: hypothetical protein ACTJHL_07895 [Neisseriaceae bacterium]